MKLELFMFDTCPFCKKVINYIESSGRDDIEYHNIHENKADEERLLAVGGKIQVPCLFIDGKPMYESNDIIEWLKAN